MTALLVLAAAYVAVGVVLAGVAFGRNRVQLCRDIRAVRSSRGWAYTVCLVAGAATAAVVVVPASLLWEHAADLVTWVRARERAAREVTR